MLTKLCSNFSSIRSPKFMISLIMGIITTFTSLLVPTPFISRGATDITNLPFGRPLPFILQDQSKLLQSSHAFMVPPFSPLPLLPVHDAKVHFLLLPFTADVFVYSFISFILISGLWILYVRNVSGKYIDI